MQVLFPGPVQCCTREAVTRPTVESLTRICTLAFICGRVEILIALQFVTMHEQVGIQHAFMEMHQMLSIKFENPFIHWYFCVSIVSYQLKGSLTTFLHMLSRLLQ